MPRGGRCSCITACFILWAMWCGFTPSGTRNPRNGTRAQRMAVYVANLDTQVPFDRRAGDAPAFSEQDIEDIVAFLRTLSDGYLPP